MKINKRQRGEGGNYCLFRLLTPSAPAIRWQSTRTPSPQRRYLPSPKCRVRLQRGRQQQPAHKNERRGALDAAAAMRSNVPQNQPPFFSCTSLAIEMKSKTTRNRLAANACCDRAASCVSQTQLALRPSGMKTKTGTSQDDGGLHKGSCAVFEPARSVAGTAEQCGSAQWQ